MVIVNLKFCFQSFGDYFQFMSVFFLHALVYTAHSEQVVEKQ